VVAIVAVAAINISKSQNFDGETLSYYLSLFSQ